MKVAIIDDAGFGFGRPGLFGKELYVHMLAEINERILDNEVQRILVGQTATCGNVSTIAGSKVPVVRAFRDSVLERRLHDVLANKKPDILHVNVLNARYPRCIVPVAKKLGIPIVVTLHSWVYLCPTGWSVYLPELVIDSEPHPRLRCVQCLCQVAKMYDQETIRRVSDGFNQTIALRRLAENAEAVISPSGLLAERVRAAFHSDNVCTVPNPLPTQLLEHGPKHGGDGSLVFFARLTYEKGAHLLPRVAESLPDINIHVMGSGPLENQTKKASETWKNILYHGFAAETSKLEIIRRSSVVLMPGLYTETFGYTMAEAFALGKAVVCFAIGGPKEMVEASGGGLLAKPFDIKDFAQKARYLAENPAAAEEMGLRGRRWAEDNLHPSQYGKVLDGIYSRITSAF